VKEVRPRAAVMRQAVVVVHTAAGGTPTALLDADPTPLTALLTTLRQRGWGDVTVLTRSQWESQVRTVVANRLPVLGYRDVPEALQRLGDVLTAGSGPVLLIHGDVVVHSEALGDVADDPRLRTAVLTAADPAGTLHVREGRVVSAGSREHRLDVADHAHLGVVRIGAGERGATAAVCGDLARLARLRGWTADPIDLVTVGLVRRAGPVAAVALGGYCWARPDSVEAARAAVRALETRDQWRVRLDAAARPGDGFYSTFVVRRLSKPLTGVAVRQGWRPNQITVVSLLIGLTAAVCFALGGRGWLLAGAILLQVSLVVDCVDGEVARFTRNFSPLGAWLDATSDRVKEYAAYAGLAVGAATDAWTLAAAALALQVSRHVVDFGFAVRQTQRRDASGPHQPSLDNLDELDDPDRAGDRSLSAPDIAPVAEDVEVAQALGRGAVQLSERTSGSPALLWLKRVVIMPIGERWLVLSAGAVLLGPRSTLWLLLALSAIAATYTTSGRVLRSVADG
jgi:hypothetical protein